MSCSARSVTWVTTETKTMFKSEPVPVPWLTTTASTENKTEPVEIIYTEPVPFDSSASPSKTTSSTACWTGAALLTSLTCSTVSCSTGGCPAPGTKTMFKSEPVPVPWLTTTASTENITEPVEIIYTEPVPFDSSASASC